MTAATLRPTRLPDLDLRIPTSVAELTELMADGFRAWAGGTDVLIEASQIGEPRRVASTAGIAELASLDIEADRVRIGGSVVLTRLVADATVRANVPAVTEGAHRIGSVQLRNSATLVGNLCTASPAGDTIPGLLVHDAIIDTINSSGQTRSIAVDEFVSGPGTTVLMADELVTSVDLTTLSPAEGSAYRRFTERNAIDLAFASVAAKVAVEPDGRTVRSVRLALGAVGPAVLDASAIGRPLCGGPITPERLQAVADAAADFCSPISDLRCSADYRRQLVRVLTVEVVNLALTSAADRQAGDRT